MIGGYAHPKHQALLGQAPSAEFVARCPENVRELLTGRPLWTWPERHRTLAMPAARPHPADVEESQPFVARMWSSETDAANRPVRPKPRL